MILIIDNYDSFTYNLVHMVATEGIPYRVIRNDELTLDEISKLDPDKILISPGPGRPEDAGVSESLILKFGETKPILGVCLGHQAIGHVFGADVVYAPTLMHGKTSQIYHDGKTLFKGIDDGFIATRYHSLVLNPETIPECLEVSARTSDGVIMGVRHQTFPIEGIQFHPESILTTEGKSIIRNWINQTHTTFNKAEMSA